MINHSFHKLTVLSVGVLGAYTALSKVIAAPAIMLQVSGSEDKVISYAQ